MARKKAPESPLTAAKAASEPQGDASLVGRTIVEVRRMRPAEAATDLPALLGRHGATMVLVLDDGTKLYPSRDDEGNGPGALFGVSTGGSFRVG